MTIQAQILQLLKNLQNKYKLSIIYITHDLGVVAKVADRIAVMYAGDIVEIGCAEEIFYNAKHPYTWALLSSLPQLGVKGEPLYSIKGTPPNLFNEIKGDAFASRNPKALKIDFVLRPPYFSVSPTHKAKTWLLDPRSPKVEPPEELSSRFPHEFSGGQRQRIGISRALVMEPELIIADEPISALDVSIRAQVLNLLSNLQKEKGLTYLLISHDLSVVRFTTDRLAIIHKGKIVEMAETEKLFNNPVHPYTRALLSAIPIPDPRIERQRIIEIYDPRTEDSNNYRATWVEVEAEHFVLVNEVL